MIRRTIAASAAIISLSSCSGTVESALEQAEPESGPAQVQGTVQTTTITVEVTTTQASPDTTVGSTTTTEPTITLPGNGAALQLELSELDGWSYYPAEKWTLIESQDAEAQVWESATGQITIRTIDVPAEIVAERRVQLEDAATTEYGDVRIYGGDYYYHADGFEAVWSRFDWVQPDVWTSVQRYWIISESEVLEITLTGDDPQAFEDELFLLQGVINKIARN